MKGRENRVVRGVLECNGAGLVQMSERPDPHINVLFERVVVREGTYAMVKNTAVADNDQRLWNIFAGVENGAEHTVFAHIEPFIAALP